MQSRLDNHVVGHSPEGGFEGIGRGDAGVVGSDRHAHTVADRQCGSRRGWIDSSIARVRWLQAQEPGPQVCRSAAGMARKG